MAERRIYIAGKNGIETEIIEFKWEPGMSIQQRRRSAVNLQDKFHEKYPDELLMEISSAAPVGSLGVQLSAFNLKCKFQCKPNVMTTVEKVYQGSKIMLYGGKECCLHDLYFCADSMTAKKDPRLKGEIVGFNLAGIEYDMKPKTAFYNWLYMVCLYYYNRELYDKLVALNCHYFSDTQAKLTVDACQAEACALLMFMKENGLDFTKFEIVKETMEDMGYDK